MTTRKHNSQSLIPYLDPDNSNFFLKIPIRSEDPAVFENGINPFIMITESGPLARIMKGQFATNAGSEMRRVFLLLQKDEYHFAKDELLPVNNSDIDHCWQEAFSLHSGKKQDDFMLLSDQISSEGSLLPFQSLFFCKVKQRFFHPLCPACGFALQQCYNDDLLRRFGLQPYSTSTKRYLFCPSCFDSKGKSDFYTVSLESADPPLLKDHLDLIKEFGGMAEDRGHPAQFPCEGCPTHPECYGAEGLAVSRIVPFSFYPFFMLIFDAMSVNAVDFLSLISGASFEELATHLEGKQEPGRINCLKDLQRKSPVRTPFFFDRDDRYFLEVLYLKISFLSEFVQTVLPELDKFRYPDFGISMDRIWVKLADQGGLLPFFWDFKVTLMDIIGRSAGTSSFPKVPPSYGLHFLGLVWFYALLGNKKQGMSEVYGVIGQAMEDAALNGDMDPDNILRNGYSPVFSPENIFWNPDVWKGKSINDTWKSLWEESLGLGLSLLQAGLKGGPEWSKENFLQDLENIRKNVKDNLFQQGVAVLQKEPLQEYRAIQNILSGIMEKWSRDLETRQDESDETIVLPPSSDSASAPSEGMPQDDEDAQATVVLSPDGLVREAAPPVSEKGELDETVILSPKSGGAPVASEDIPQYDEDVQHTVVLSSDGLVKESAFPVPEADGLDETVIFSPDGLREKTPPSVQAENDLDETVILSPGGLSKGEPLPVQKQESDIPQTVIISPSDSEKLRLHSDSPAHLPPEEGGFEKTGPALSGNNEQKLHTTSGDEKAVNEPDEDDFLDETVILRPGKDRESDQ